MRWAGAQEVECGYGDEAGTGGFANQKQEGCAVGGEAVVDEVSGGVDAVVDGGWEDMFGGQAVADADGGELAGVGVALEGGVLAGWG